MRHLSRGRAGGFVLALCCLALSTGCKPDDVGLPCTVQGSSGDAGSTSTRINTQALDCRSRLCIFYGGGAEAARLGPLCTEVCESDSDCPDSTDKCPRGFRCVVGVQVGSLKCCRVCVCRTLVTEADARDPPACRNFAANCPSL